MTPNSAASPAPGGDEASSPPSGALLSPKSPHSIDEDADICGQQNEKCLGSPRCASRESVDSYTPPCLPPDTLLSDRDLLRGIPLPSASLSPLGIALPPTLPAVAAAALLPPQSAAMAAYLNAAAAAVQHSHRLMMTSPLPSYSRVSASPHISSSSSPPPNAVHISSISPLSEQLESSGVLDFSKHGPLKSEMNDGDMPIMNLSKTDIAMTDGESHFNSPLDLSVTTRKRSGDDVDAQHSVRRARTDYKSQLLSQWPSPIAPPHLPYFAAAVAAANLSPKPSNSESWNGKLKYTHTASTDANKALEKMSELSKLGGEDLFRSMTSTSVNSSNNRHSAWQSHWLNKGAEQAKDVLKCVWCKQSFPSLAAMTTHMKEAKHCGVSVPASNMHSQNLPPQPPISSPSNSNASSGVSSTSSSHKPNQSDLNLLIKETMPLPRKLVRGQDVWLGKGAEQTRQILKCMWCGQSFRSLAEMTSHMQQTQHYTNIISQEQIISWKSTDDPKVSGGASSGSSTGGNVNSANSHVSAVLTCKVCDQAFSSLKELSNHMVKNSHYKEHIMRSITDGGRRRQTREKRKKSLPVRKLLELERAQHDFKNGDTNSLMGKMHGIGRITCEKCGDKIDTSHFVDHIRQCIGGGVLGNNQRNFLKSALVSNSILPPENLLDSGQNPNRENGRTNDSPSTPTDLAISKGPSNTESTGSAPSVLNAIEKLIEKSFDSRGRQNAGFPSHGPAAPPMGSSILKRLGIDETVDYTKPLVDVQTMNFLRSYHQQQSHHYVKRERSGSESSSMSERGSRVDSLTPERKGDLSHHPITSTPRSTPDKREKSPPDRDLPIKREMDDNDGFDDPPQSLCIKREALNESEEYDDRDSVSSRNQSSKEVSETHGKVREVSPVNSPQRHTPSVDAGQSPCRNSTCSPASSDRSVTPRSTNDDKKGSSSLGALSSMFDNLSSSGIANENSTTTGKRTSSHPLAALQKLCDKTETHHTSRSNVTPVLPNSNVSNSIPATHAAGPTPGAILAFSWACNDAVMTADSIMKCAFCDTPFISKGAYRHHLSKMHFVKDGVIPDPVALKSPQPPSASTSMGMKPASAGPPSTSGNLLPSDSKSPPVTGGYEESPHSKFLKYTELAKQLSSKYV